MIKRLKYGGDLKFSRVIGELLSGEIIDRIDPLLIDALIPVPMHRLRYLERGFNQAEQIARVVGRRTGLPVLENHTRRIVAKKAQSGLSAKAREKNMMHAFEVCKDLTGMRIAIVDDVYTTGATARSLARTLNAAGVADVCVWAFARTP